MVFDWTVGGGGMGEGGDGEDGSCNKRMKGGVKIVSLKKDLSVVKEGRGGRKETKRETERKRGSERKDIRSEIML